VAALTKYQRTQELACCGRDPAQGRDEVKRPVELGEAMLAG